MKILDAFCGAGGAYVGYLRAGFVGGVGVDLEPQPRFPGPFEQWDALAYIEAHWSEYDAIHASPPCQAYSDLQRQSKIVYNDLIGPTREILRSTGLPYVIENVETAPLIDPIMLCGTMFPGLRVLRHRLFESNVPLAAPASHPRHPLVFTHDKRKAHHGQLDQATAFVQVTGGGNATIANKRAAMGVDWPMTNLEINEAIPPAYTEYVGRQLLAALEV